MILHRKHTSKYSKGFTLIELMITIAVMAVLLVIAIPSFTEFRQRAALRGAADQVATFWGDARFEALRRNQMVKVGVSTNAAKFCLGAATTTNAADATPCNCFLDLSLTQVGGACDVSVYPGNADTNQAEWRGIAIDSAATLGQNTGVAVIDPKRGKITETADEGRILLRTPSNANANYRLNINFDRQGRAIICEPTAAPNKLPQFTNRRC